MKQPINEIKRMQQLAGVINESQDIEESIGKTLGTAALGAALALGTPKTATAQSPQQIEKSTQARLSDEEIGDKMWHIYDSHRSKVNLEQLGPELIKLISAASKEAMEYGYPYESVKKLGRAVKKVPAAMNLVNTDEEKLRAASMRGYDDINETVNEALASLREEETEEELTPDQIAVLKNIVKLSEAAEGDDKAKYEKLKSELKKATLTAAFVATLITSMSSCRTSGYGCHGRESWGGMVKRINRP